MAKNLLISVVVPSYNEEAYIEKCLESLVKQDLDKEKYEIIVIDNASTDQTTQIAGTYPVQVIKEPKKGYVFAIIKGVNVSKAKIVAFTDADTIVPHNWLSKILKSFKNNPRTLAVGGAYVFYRYNNLLNTFFKKTNKYSTQLCGANMAFKKDALKKIGGIDPRVNFSVDFYLTRQLKRIGQVIIDPTIVVKTSPRRFKKNRFSYFILQLINQTFLTLLDRPLIFDIKDVR